MLSLLLAGCVLIPVASVVVGQRATALGPFALLLGLIASLAAWGAVALLVAFAAAIRQRTLVPSGLPSPPPGKSQLLVGSPLAAAVAALIDAALGDRLAVTLAAYVTAGIAHGVLAYVLARAGYLEPASLGEDDGATPP